MFLYRFFKKIKISFIFIFFFLLFIFSFQVFAQERIGIGISPFIIEENVKPGQFFEKEITVTNRSNEKKTFQVFLQDIKLTEDGQILFLDAGSEKFSIKEFVNFPEEKIEILPYESKKIPIFFNISGKISGSRQGAIILKSETQTSTEREKGKFFASFSQQLGVLVFLRSSEKVIEEARILRFSTDKKYYWSPFKINFSTEIENDGNVYIVPMGVIKIENIFKKEVASLMFNPQNLKILPETKRNFEQLWEGKFGFGKYSAYLFINFGSPPSEGGEGIKSLFAKYDFWIFPKKELLTFIFLIFLVILLILFFYQRKKN